MAESTKDLVPRFFNKTTLCYDKIINRTTFRKDKYWKKEILKKIPQSESILDLACGTGILTRQISEKFPNAKNQKSEIDNGKKKASQQMVLSYLNVCK